jgi:LPS O-antigen subunit length determinant protein (WzzB/FepE family)
MTRCNELIDRLNTNVDKLKQGRVNSLQIKSLREQLNQVSLQAQKEGLFSKNNSLKIEKLEKLTHCEPFTPKII